MVTKGTMTLRKAAPANAQYLRDSPNTDHSAHLQAHNTHNHVRQPSEPCDQNVVLETRRCSKQHYRQRSTNDSSGTQKTILTRKVEPTQSYSPTEPSTLLELNMDRSMTRKSLEAFLTPLQLERLQISTQDLGYLWSASLDPPITKASLRELELTRIISDATLRHDLNFEHEVSFKPDLCGSRGKRKLADAENYWAALIIEFALYMTRQRCTLSAPCNTHFQTQSPWLLPPSSLREIPYRLSRMFDNMRDILKTLVPGHAWSSVDSRLDVELLMQELENGICDIAGLSKWLGALLVGCCSPQRDPLVADMVSAIQIGVKNDDARALVEGLRLLFGVLENMKLDVANHQIRYLRTLMVDDTVDFEQKSFLREISNGWDLTNVRVWFQRSGTDVESQENQRRGLGFSSFMEAVVDIIIAGNRNPPPTFKFDLERFRALHADFRVCIYQTACGQAFVNAIHCLGWTGLPSLWAYNDLLGRISAIAGPRRSDYDQASRDRDIALEIVRAAHELTNNQTLPSEALLGDTERALRDAWKSDSAVFGELQNLLRRDLKGLVHREVEAIIDMTPLQILNHLSPIPNSTQAQKEQNGLHSMAKRIAHIAVLHWRVWAPILYEQPCGATDSTSNRETLEEGEVDPAGKVSIMGFDEQAPENIAPSSSAELERAC